MQAGVFAFILAMFALAGFVKGVIGLGLPTISMGLLVLVMRPVEAAVLVLPSLLTNVWQMLAGPSLTSALKALGLSFTVSTLALAVNVAPADVIGGRSPRLRSRRWRSRPAACGSVRRCVRACCR